MKPSTFTPMTILAAQTPTTTTDTKTFTLPAECSAFIISAETNDARITIDGTTPTATVGHKIPKDQAPVLMLLGPGTTVKAVSTAAGNSVIQITPLS